MRRRSNPWLGLVNGLLGAVAALVGGAVAEMAGEASSASPVVLWLGLLAWSLVGSLLLTLLIPSASNFCAPTGYALLWITLAAVLLITGVDRGEPLAFPLLLAGLLAWPLGYLGVYAARRFGPDRCRMPKYTRPGEPRCPKCGQVLYYAANQTCPECGRYFSLRKVDMRRAQWDGYVLRPWEPVSPEPPCARAPHET
jgi:ribosomal protein L37E